MSVPKLRFKEFNSDWTFKNLSDVSNKPLYGMNSAATDFDGENKYLRITDIDEESHRFKFTKLSSPSDVIEEKYILKEGDLLFARTGASVGKSYIYDPDDGKVVFAGFLIKFGLKESVIPYFIFTQTLSEKFNNWVITNSMRSGQPGINAEEYSKWQIAFTSKPEQTKITSFLSAVDEKISQLTQKHELLSQYKQGMMQKLFSQQIRFKADDGSEFGEWENKTLGEVGENIIGLTYSPTDVTNDSTGILVLRSSNIKEGRLDKSDQVRVNKKIKDKIIIQPNDILICTRNGSQRLIGKSVIINDDEIMTFGAFMSVYRSDYNRFIAYLMQTPWFFEQVQMNLGARINQITTGTLNEFTFDFPCLEEQTKIANFLSAIDQKNEVVAQQIEQAKIWKKGLLQQMFV